MGVVAGFASQIILGMYTNSPLKACFCMAFRTQFRAAGNRHWFRRVVFRNRVMAAQAGDTIGFPGSVGGIVARYVTY